MHAWSSFTRETASAYSVERQVLLKFNDAV